MADLKFPLSVYNKDGAVLQVNTPDDLAKAKLKGYGPKYVHSHFPKVLYGKTSGGTLRVNSETELQAALAGDYTEEFVAAPAPATKLAPVEVIETGDTATTRALLEELRSALNRIDDLEARVEDLEAKATEDLPEAPAPASKTPKAPKAPKIEEAPKASA